jgi:hypothetical protein
MSSLRAAPRSAPSNKDTAVSDQGDMPILSSPSGRMGAIEPFSATCRDLVLAEMPSLLDGLFRRMDEALKDLADKAESDARFRACLDVMQRLRRRRTAFKSRFLAELDAGWAALDADAIMPIEPRPGPPRVEEAAPAGQREEGLVLANLVSKAESRYRTELEALRGLVAARRGREIKDIGSDPLGPFAICEAFRTTLQSIGGLDLSTRLVLYKLFDKQVMDALGGLYARCLACVDAPAFPGASPVPSVPDAQAPSGGGASSAFDRLRLLLRGRRGYSRSAPGAVLVQTEELLSVLSRLEAQSARGAVDASQVDLLRRRLREELRLRVGPSVGCALVQADEDTLDLVFLLFERILRGRALPDAIKALIARLQIPIAKVALADKSFFEDRDHPARRVLNHLAETARGWVDDGERSPEGVYGRIRWAVEEVLAGYGGDPDIFARLDAVLCVPLAREREQARASEAGARRALEERERRVGVQALVRGVIDERLGAYDEVPDVVSSLVYEGWEQVMLAAYGDGGTAGARWRSALATLDRLLWSVQPKLVDEDRRELLRGIPELLRVLRESLAEVAYDPRRLAAGFRELQALHIAALRRAEGPGGVATEASRHAPARALPPGGPAPVSVGGRGKGAERPPAAGLRIGSWVEMRRGEGPMRAKLAWHGAASGLHLFVDRRGQKAMEVGEEDLQTLFAQGMAVIVDEETPLVDRALQTLVQSLERA